ncbi:MAG: hypothetical protein Q8S03_15425 [Brevundimonas sp.]|uniref:hypothetical protein n=1 Tax=Brevundimonas sp. TaxID=1871086 RepID=UPI002735E3C7|nr:hypothetical protein [Brevundimonas sp.]MDP3406078.1 hypothetical protein [Brevundimonas sp.]
MPPPWRGGNPPPSGEGDREAVEGANPGHRIRVGPPPSRREAAPRHLPRRGRIRNLTETSLAL